MVRSAICLARRVGTRGASLVNFNKLKKALHKWVHEAVAHLASGPEPDTTQDLRRWQRDTDGVVRDRERMTRVWRHAQLEALQQLPSWRAVAQALQDNGRLRAQLNQLVGTVQGSSLLEAERVGRIVLPLPDEVEDLEAVFTRRYERLDRFLAAKDIEYAVVWPLTRAPAFSRYGAYVRIVGDDPAVPRPVQKQCSPLRGCVV